MPEPVRVFISYSHDSAAHSDRVRQFADGLRADGFDAWIDQYDLPPAEGWPRWMEGQMAKADFVLLVCTAPYARRFTPEPGQGSGVGWEAELVRSELLARGENKRFIPILVGESGAEEVPAPLRTYPRYGYPADYEALLRHLSGLPKAMAPEIGRPTGRVPLPAIQPRSGGAVDDEEDVLQRYASAPYFLANTGGRGAAWAVLGVAAFAAAFICVFLAKPLHDERWKEWGFPLLLGLSGTSSVTALLRGRRHRIEASAALRVACARLRASRRDAFHLFAQPSKQVSCIVRVSWGRQRGQGRDLRDALTWIDLRFGGGTSAIREHDGGFEIEKETTRRALFRWFVGLARELPGMYPEVPLAGTEIIEQR